jgi:drug/metabolite transporter (DMT)-like permease
MTLLAAALVIAAAGIHAFWNLIGKRRNPSAAFFLIGNLAASICLLPLLARNRPLLAAIPAPVWALIVLTGLCEALYYAALAGAYRNGDMSVAYPLARALPAVLIALCTVVFGLGKPLTMMGIVGIGAVVVGCLLTPLPSLRKIRPSDYLTAVCLLAVVAAVATAGYTLIDNENLGRLRALPGLGLSNIEITLTYLELVTISTLVWLAPYTVLVPAERERLQALASNGLLGATAAGLLITFGYSLVLAAMAHATNVSYIAAFRQTSIPLGATLGIVVQKEPAYATKLVGIAVVLAGLLLVALA